MPQSQPKYMCDGIALKTETEGAFVNKKGRTELQCSTDGLTDESWKWKPLCVVAAHQC